MSHLNKRRRGRPRVAGLPERRREEILAAATALFARRGYPGTDLQAVADRLKVAKGTLYRYFATKEELFLSTVARGVRRLSVLAEAEAGRAREPLDRIVRATRAYLDFFHRQPEVLELIVQERAEFRERRHTYFEQLEAGIGPWRELIRGLMKDGTLRRVPVDRVVRVLSELVYGAVLTNYFAKRRPDPGVQAGDILDIVFHGILRARA